MRTNFCMVMGLMSLPTLLPAQLETRKVHMPMPIYELACGHDAWQAWGLDKKMPIGAFFEKLEQTKGCIRVKVDKNARSTRAT